MIGQKVKLTKSMAKGTLHKPEAYIAPSGRKDDNFDFYMQMSMFVLLGGDVVGEVIKQGATKETYGVQFNTPFGKDYGYYEYPTHITKCNK